MEQHTHNQFPSVYAGSLSNFHRSVWRTGVRWTLLIVSLPTPLILLCSLFSELHGGIVVIAVVLMQTFVRLLSWSKITASESLTPQATVVVLVFWKLFFAIEVNFSEPRLRPKRGKMLFSTWSWALMSFPLVHKQAFINDFLKLSLHRFKGGFVKKRKKERDKER